MPPRRHGKGHRGGRPPARGRGRGRSPTCKGLVNQIGPVRPLAAPLPFQPLAGLDHATTTLMRETFNVMMQTMMATQQEQAPNNQMVTREARHLQDFREYNPRVFSGASEDLIVTELWLSSMERIFRLMNCPDDQKVSCASFMLQDDAHIWWQSAQEVLSPNGGVISWPQFREAFCEEYYPETARLQKQQEFIYLTQNGRSVTAYGREFMRLMRFAPELVDTEVKKAERFVLGLDEGIRCVVEAIAPTTYADARRSAMAMERGRSEGLSGPTTLIAAVGQKRRYDQISPHHQSQVHSQQQTGRPRGNLGRGQQPGQSGDRGDEKPLCNECRRKHGGQCFARTGACFSCGQQGHISRNCPRRNAQNPVNQPIDSSGAGRSM